MNAELLAGLRSRARAMAGTIRSLDFRQIKSRTKELVKKHPLTTIAFCGMALIFCGCHFIIPPQGRIIAIGPEIRQAYELLKSTPTGNKIIQHARRSTKGSPVFLLFGTAI
jgi:hypothetical protein